jgi:hypothetical protein
LDSEFPFDPIYLERGRVVHLATLRLDLGAPVTGVMAGVEDAWHPFIVAYQIFRHEVRCRWKKMEHPKVHRRLRFASIIDRVGTVSGRPTVFEIKTGFPAPFHGPQLAAADILVTGRVRLGLRRRLAVYLHADGTYKLQEYTDPADYTRFLQALATYHQPERVGIEESI